MASCWLSVCTSELNANLATPHISHNCSDRAAIFCGRRGEWIQKEEGRPHSKSESLTISVLSLRRHSRHSCAVALLQSGTDVTVIRHFPGHASATTTGRYLTTNLKLKRDAMLNFWKNAGIESSRATPWKPKPDLPAFLQSI